MSKTKPKNTEQDAPPHLTESDREPIEVPEKPIPDSIEDRPYIEIRPTETSTDPGAICQAMELLCTSLQEVTKTGWGAKLTGKTQIPLVEWLLVADGDGDSGIRYFIGSTYSDFTEDLETILRTAFPQSYEFRFVQWHPRRLLAEVPPGREQLDERPDDPEQRVGLHHPAITPEMPYVAGVEYRGHTSRGPDWQTPLTAYDAFTAPRSARLDRSHRQESRRVPLASLVDVMCESSIPVVYQVVCRPYSDWSSLAEAYLRDLETGTASFTSRLWDFLSPRSREEKQAYQPRPRDQLRIDAITQRDPRRTFCVSARTIALTREVPAQADAVARRMSNALGHVGGKFHEIRGHTATDDEFYATSQSPGVKLFEDLCSRASHHVTYQSLGNYLLGRTPQSQGIVTSPGELASFCCLDGGALTPRGQRALATRTAERTAITLPSPEQLRRYGGAGMVLCLPLTHDRQVLGQPIVLPPDEQDRHVLVIGNTGAGKTILIQQALLSNVQATDGPEILIDSKGGGTAREYLQAHYAAHGNLDDVLYFDCTRVLPASGFFDIGPLLEAGVPQEEARARKVVAARIVNRT